MTRAKRILAHEYLRARAEAWQKGVFPDGRPMDPMVTDFRSSVRNKSMLWLTFMAGSDWERRYTGRRYTDESEDPAARATPKPIY